MAMRRTPTAPHASSRESRPPRTLWQAEGVEMSRDDFEQLVRDALDELPLISLQSPTMW